MIIFLFIVAAGFNLLNSTAYFMYIPAAAACAIFIYGAARKIIAKEDPGFFAVQAGILSCFCVCWTVREYSAAFYHALSDVSLAFSGAAGWIIGKPVAMGVTYSGTDLIFLFAIAFVFVNVACKGKQDVSVTRATSSTSSTSSTTSYASTAIVAATNVAAGIGIAVAIDLGALAVIWAAYVWLWTVLAENSIALGVNLVEPLTGPLDFRMLLFAMLSLLYHLRHGKHAKRNAASAAAAAAEADTYRRLMPSRSKRSFAVIAQRNAPAIAPRSDMVKARRTATFIALALPIAVCAPLLIYSPGMPQADPERRIAQAASDMRIAQAASDMRIAQGSSDMRIAQGSSDMRIAQAASDMRIAQETSDMRIAQGSSVKRVVFWDTGIDFSLPKKEEYGLDRVGMFGVLPHYLENRGYACDIVDEVGTDTLAGAAALVVINPMRAPSGDMLVAVKAFAQDGGGVLAAGDHTGDEQIRKPLNKLLAPVGIELNFDSAIPFQTLWPYSFYTRKSPIFNKVTGRQLQVVVGASLSYGYHAKPLMIGRTGYSDSGNIHNVADGYLGDMSFSRGERVGDLVVAAEAGLGRGRYLVFADTTLFQNTSLAYSAPFIDNIFAYLASSSSAAASALPDSTAAQSAYSVAAPSDSAAAPSDSDTPLRDDGGRKYNEYCLIDARNIPAFSFDKSGNAADGFIAGVLRSGMLPYLNLNESIADALRGGGNGNGAGDGRSSGSSGNGSGGSGSGGNGSGGSGGVIGRDIAAVVLDEPARPLSEDDISELYKLLDRGGTVILLGCYESPGAALDLCARFGFSFDNLPIGRIAPTSNPDMAFWDACPVIYDGGESENLISIWGYDVVTRAGLSNGEIIAVGDAGFIKNKNLESVSEYREGNVKFIEGMLERALSRYREHRRTNGR